MAVCPNGAIEEPEWNILKKNGFDGQTLRAIELIEGFLSAGKEKVSRCSKRGGKNFHANSVHLLFMKKSFSGIKKFVRVSRKKKND